MDRPGLGLRRLIGLLLALNVGALAAGLVAAYWPGKPDLILEFNADKVVRLASPEGKKVPPVRDPVAQEASSPADCLAWKGLDADGVEKLEASLERMGLARTEYVFQLEKPLGWWVYLPPFPDGDSLRQATELLRAKGVTDFAPVRGGSMANALSLGAFPSLEKARLHEKFLISKGLVGIRSGPRPGDGVARLLLNKAVAADFVSRLAAELPSDLKPGACPTVSP